jgi:NitT/TauT family transport system permease protein
VISVDLPHPRTAAIREDPRFFELVTSVREALHLGSDLDRKLEAPPPWRRNRDHRAGRCPADPRGTLAGRVGRRALDWVPAVVVLVLVFVVWQESIAIFHIKRFLAPQPTDIASAFWTNRHELISAGWFTFQEALGGFAIGSGLALVMALVLARWRGLARALMPYMIAANAIPIIAFAPIMNAWFDPFSKGSKMAIAAVLCFFPVLVNTLRG